MATFVQIGKKTVFNPEYITDIHFGSTTIFVFLLGVGEDGKQNHLDFSDIDRDEFMVWWEQSADVCKPEVGE